MVDIDPNLSRTVDKMFSEAAALKKLTPLGNPQVDNFDDFLKLLNAIMCRAPEYTLCPDSHKDYHPCGQIACPISALLDWPMGMHIPLQDEHLLQLKMITPCD